MLKYKLLTSLIGVILMTVPLLVNASASTGMSNCTEEPESEDCNPQPDRVGNDHDENNEVTRDGPDEQEDANCWGKVTSDFTSQKDGEGGGGQVFGQHSSDPVGGDSDNETLKE